MTDSATLAEWHQATLTAKRAQVRLLGRLYDKAAETARHTGGTQIADALWAGRCALQAEVDRLARDLDNLSHTIR